jgi:hypothetical protein
MPASTGGQARQPRGIIGVLPYLLDVVVPLAVYYGLTSAGLSSFWSLVAGGALTAAISVVNTIRRGKLDSLGVLVIAELVLGLVLILTVREARLTLAVRSLSIAVAGIWMLASALTGRPVTVDATKPIAAGKAGRDGIIAVEWLAANSRPFVRIHRALSGVWGVMFLLYAAVRVVIIYDTSVSRAVWVTEIPGIIAIGICLIASARAGKRLEALVTERMGQAVNSSICPD